MIYAIGLGIRHNAYVNLFDYEQFERSYLCIYTCEYINHKMVVL